MTPDGGGHRFMRIVIDRERIDSDPQLLGSIGHELQHAWRRCSVPLAAIRAIIAEGAVKRVTWGPFSGSPLGGPGFHAGLA